jgi:ribosome-binding ATPase YchF (GTP1/OBG family)
VAAFGGADPLADLRSFEEDLLLADLEIVSGRVDRIKEGLKKPRPKEEREQQEHELAALAILQATLESGKHAREASLSEEQWKFTRAFRLLTEKPKMVLLNLADDDPPDRFAPPPDAAAANIPWSAVPLRMELDLAEMSPEDRHAFEQEFGLERVDRDHVLRQIMAASGQMLYFTAGEKEVRTWLLRTGGTALEAAENIHTDLARGFIRAEVMRSADLLRLGSEREIKSNGLMRQEPKDYVVQEGDVLHIKFNV